MNTLSLLLFFLPLDLLAQSSLVDFFSKELPSQKIEISSTQNVLRAQERGYTPPPYLSFLLFYQDSQNFVLPASYPEVRKVASQLNESQSLYEFYDEAYQSTQEVCAFEEKVEVVNKCDSLLSYFSKVNDSLNGNSNQDADTSLGLSLDGFEIRKRELGEFGINEEDFDVKYVNSTRKLPMASGQEIDLTQVDSVCLLRQRIELNLESSLIEKIVGLLERELVDEQVSLASRKETYCVLEAYYTQTDNVDRLIEFLYLNMPEGLNFCS